MQVTLKCWQLFHDCELMIVLPAGPLTQSSQGSIIIPSFAQDSACQSIVQRSDLEHRSLARNYCLNVVIAASQ